MPQNPSNPLKDTANPMVQFDQGLPFLIEGTNIHGSLIRLGKSGQNILKRHRLNAKLTQILGELLALTAALYGAQKNGGILSLGINGNGSVARILSDARNIADDEIAGIGYTHGQDIALRATMEFDQTIPLPSANLQNFRGFLKEGYLILTLDPAEGGPRSQGIVALSANSLERAIDEYFQQSSQERAFCKLAAQQKDYQTIIEIADEDYSATCLLIKQMPSVNPLSQSEMSKAAEDWNRITMLVATLRDDELLDKNLSHETILQRLFHEEGVRVFEPLHYHDQCRCSKERMHSVLSSLNPSELKEMELPQGGYEVTCLFCQTSHGFTHEEVMN